MKKILKMFCLILIFTMIFPVVIQASEDNHQTGNLFGGSGDWIIVIAAYVWGWNFLKNWFGFTTIGAFFSGNIAIGVVLFVGYLIIGYVIGLITFLLGAVRYIQLRLLFKR